jgi:ketosteroid isomerase-like protein
MSCHTQLLACVSVLAATMAPTVTHAQSSQLAAELQPVLDARYAAVAHADTATLSRYIADDMVWIVIANAGGEYSKHQFLALVSQGQTPAPRYIVDSVRAKRFGDVAVVEYRRRDLRQKGVDVDTVSVQAQEVLVERQGQWMLERHTQSWIVAAAIPVKVDSNSLNAFVGRYQIARGYIDNVHWENNQLVATTSGQTTGARLVPVSATAFSPDGVGALIVFERDVTGRVIGYVQGYPNGTVWRAARLP